MIGAANWLNEVSFGKTMFFVGVIILLGMMFGWFGTVIRESIALIRANSAAPAGVLIALDRQERGRGAQSAAQEITAEFGIPVIAVARLEELLLLAAERPELAAYHARLQAYHAKYGV